MRPVLRSSILLLLAAFLLACGSVPLVSTPPGPTVTYNPFASLSPTPFNPLADTMTPTETPTPGPTMTATLQPGSRPKYNIQVMLDYARHGLSVNQTITYPNWTGVALDNIVLAVEPNHWTGCFSLITLTGYSMDGQEPRVQVGHYSLNGHRLELELDQPLSPGGVLSISIAYGLTLPYADRYQVFGYNADQIDLVDWYPFVVPYADGWLLHDPGAEGEHLVYDEADFDVTITPTGADLPPTLTMAASAPMVNGNARLEGARTFALSISSGYSQASISAAGVIVTSYYFPSEELQGQRVLQEVGKALQTYSDRFGPPPHSSLSIAEADYFDGMEYDGMFFLSRDFYTSDDGTVLNLLVDIAVHETAHQWWFSQVGSDQALEPWLDEALATYSERLFYEVNYPGVTAWQAFRVDAYNPSGWVDSSIYDLQGIRTYANAVYLRGALFLQDLRSQIGDEAFFAFLKDYASQMAGKRATTADFFRILRQHTDADLTAIMQEYFSHSY
jgi:hypothetical protein